MALIILLRFRSLCDKLLKATVVVTSSLLIYVPFSSRNAPRDFSFCLSLLRRLKPPHVLLVGELLFSTWLFRPGA